MKSRDGKSQRREEKRREEKRRRKKIKKRKSPEKEYRKNIQVCEKVGKSRNTLFFQ